MTARRPVETPSTALRAERDKRLRRLGRSGLHVTRLGFGAFKIGRNVGIKYPEGYELPDERAAERLLNGVLDLGVNYIDTAPAYGLSEERIGRALAHRRAEFVLSTKVGEVFEDGRSTYDFSAGAVRSSVERSLRRLRSDVLDIVYIHAHADDVAIMTATDAPGALSELKSSGLIRAVGLSAKTPAGAVAALKWADVLMLEYHPAAREMEPVISAAASAGVGIVIKKALAGGRLPPETALSFVLGNASVDGAVVGGLSLEHMRENWRIAHAGAASE